MGKIENVFTDPSPGILTEKNTNVIESTSPCKNIKYTILEQRLKQTEINYKELQTKYKQCLVDLDETRKDLQEKTQIIAQFNDIIEANINKISAIESEYSKLQIKSKENTIIKPEVILENIIPLITTMNSTINTLKENLNISIESNRSARKLLNEVNKILKQNIIKIKEKKELTRKWIENNDKEIENIMNSMKEINNSNINPVKSISNNRNIQKMLQKKLELT